MLTSGQHGEITDVPPSAKGTPTQYAHPVHRPAVQVPEPSVFCPTCIKNQHLLSEALSNYLPDPDDPDYPAYEANYDSFRSSLEDRYPQVCARCEPEVRARLLQAGRYAQADHVRRQNERSRARTLGSRWGWRDLLLRAGGFGCCASIMVQLLWHLIGTVPVKNSVSENASLLSCMSHLIRYTSTTSLCFISMADLTRLALVLGAACVWWNPGWRHKLDGKDGRLVGLYTYYRWQVASLSLRAVAWVCLMDPVALPASQQKMLHPVCLFLESLISGYALLFTIDVDTTPLVSWRNEVGPLISEKQYVPPANPNTQFSSRPSSQDHMSRPPSFPISSLGGNVRPFRDVWQPPTPPEEDSDAMEWEPTAGLQVKPRPTPVKIKPQLSPFYGTLPAIPNNHSLQRPGQSHSAGPRQAMGIPPGFFDKSPKLDSNQQTYCRSPRMAPPKFFPRSDMEADTGLEGMFSSVFSLSSKPSELRGQTSKSPDGSKLTSLDDDPAFNGPPALRIMKFCHTGLAVLIAAALVLWWLLSSTYGHSSTVRTRLTGLTAFVATFNLLAAFNFLDHQRTKMILSAELLLASGLFINMGLYSDEWIEKQEFVLGALLVWQFWQEVAFSGLIDVSSGNSSHASQNTEHGFAKSAYHSPLPATASQTPDQPDTHSTDRRYSEADWDNNNISATSSSFSPRPRAGSIDSVSTEASIATTSTASAWKTPKRTGRDVSQSPGFNLGALALSQSGNAPWGSRSIAPRRAGRRNGAF